MRYLAAIVFTLVAAQSSMADQLSEHQSALAKWKAANIHSYTFTYQWHGAVVIAPACADAVVEVKVRDGVGGPPTVVRGHARCPRGTRGVNAIGFPVPSTIDVAFQEMFRYVADPPTPVRITASYDHRFGVPTSYFVEKLELEDNDEGFKILDFKVAK